MTTAGSTTPATPDAPDGTGSGPPGPLTASAEALIARHDVVLLDLDGVVYIGPHAVEHAPASLDRARERGARIGFITNNAARTPDAVADSLTGMGVQAAPGDVVTSAQAAAKLVADRVPAGSTVLVVGGEGLVVALAERGLKSTSSAEDDPVAVVQGFSPHLAWSDLLEGSVAVARGLPWIASNTDSSIPTPRGRAPGNGTLVAAIAAATGRAPVVAGKPEPPLLTEAVERLGATDALFVGDRLDTDIEGAARVGMASLLVLTGVTAPVDLVLARPAERPTYVSADLRGLLEPHPAPVVDGPGAASCGGWTARTGRDAGAAVELTGGGDRLDALRALSAAVWSVGTDDGPDREVLVSALARAGW